MRTFQLHILAADRVFFEGECESVVAPTASGQYGVQAHHSNMIAAISPRVVRAHGSSRVEPSGCFDPLITPVLSTHLAALTAHELVDAWSGMA